jgi:hypothetical protein
MKSEISNTSTAAVRDSVLGLRTSIEKLWCNGIQARRYERVLELVSTTAGYDNLVKPHRWGQISHLSRIIKVGSVLARCDRLPHHRQGGERQGGERQGGERHDSDPCDSGRRLPNR